MKRVVLSFLTATCFMTSSQAKNPWQEVCGHQLTQSILEKPEGDFSNYKVAVVDNGFVKEHPLIKSQLSAGWNGRDMNEDINASIVQDSNHHENGKTCSHGTHVAGIVAQMGGEVVPVKRGASGNRSVNSDKAALEYLATRHDVKIVNLSFGIDWCSLRSSIKKLAKQGKLIVIAAGNSGEAIENRTLNKLLADTSLKKRVVLVGATEKLLGKEKLISFSNKATASVESAFIAVPGRNITSSVPYDSAATGMKELSGTSMAAPIFAGVVVRLMTEFDASVDEVRQVLFGTAVKQSNSNTGQGIMDFVAARNKFKERAAAKVMRQVEAVPVVPPAVLPHAAAKAVQSMLPAKPSIKVIPEAEKPAMMVQQPKTWADTGKQMRDIATKAVKIGAAVTNAAYNYAVPIVAGAYKLGKQAVTTVAQTPYNYLRSWF
ncbi:S8 family peptidase [Candidatus Paracaedibacter symbiosus]|uniref:S8 family peptidase n=1 Tax=Candidatus Paracaedibacter symbiosus TaxID=244582 RepID=UPI0005099558|nr:S8 family serine peptidase [Candidatus Paracaedibacter symbiosus]